MRFDRVWRLAAAVTMLTLALTVGGRGTRTVGAAANDGTPTAGYSCDQATPVAEGSPSGMDMGTPAAGMDMSQTVEFDQLYIDMMIPHHTSIVALAQAALPRLTDERLTTIAQNIIDAQTAEVTELRGYREQFYGSPEPMPMDAHMMDLMSQAMPGMGSMEEMALQMDAQRQVAAFCAGSDPDVAFIDLTIPHHEMAIAASRAALGQATHDEIRSFAERVIDAQQGEIEELTAIRAELTGAATPTS